jgi:hypothetical protein
MFPGGDCQREACFANAAGPDERQQPHLGPHESLAGAAELYLRCNDMRMSSTIRDIVDRAVSDSEFLARLADDAIGTAYAEAYAVSAEEIKALLGLNHVPDREVVLVLQARLAAHDNLLT